MIFTFVSDPTKGRLSKFFVSKSVLITLECGQNNGIQVWLNVFGCIIYKLLRAKL